MAARPLCGWACAAVLVCLVAPGATDPPPIELTTKFRFGFAPAAFRVRVRIDPHEENRAVCVTYEGSGGFYRRSCWELEGRDAPITTWLDLKDLPAGTYEMVGGLARSTRVLQSAVLRFEVLARQ